MRCPLRLAGCLAFVLLSGSALAGYEVAGRCLPDLAEASAALCAHTGTTVLPVSGGFQLAECESVNSSTTGALKYRTGFQPIGGTYTVSSKVLVPAYQPCSVLDWSDGLALGWGVALAWLAAFGLLSMRKGL